MENSCRHTPEMVTKRCESRHARQRSQSTGKQIKYIDFRYHQSEMTGGIFIPSFKKGKVKEMKAMLSQPMAGKTDEEIIVTREKAVKALQKRGYEVVNTLFTDEWYSNESMKERGVVQIPLCFLAKSLENMSLCHAAYFCKGWENARGCRIEHDAALAYGLEVIYEE